MDGDLHFEFITRKVRTCYYKLLVNTWCVLSVYCLYEKGVYFYPKCLTSSSQHTTKHTWR